LAIEHSREEVENEAPRRRSSGKGTKKRFTKKKSAGKRTRAESRSDVTARRTRRTPPTTKFSFKPKKSDGGSVIGGD
jgi:hypothetical protein